MNKLSLPEQYKAYQGEIEFIIKDKHGRVLDHLRQHNIVKIFAKEILAHRIPSEKVWDTNANGGTGAWVSHDINIEEFSVKYISI